jgi:two-component system nitrogen regulation response regulator GlnG
MNSSIQVDSMSSKEGREHILSLVNNYIRISEEQIKTGFKKLSKEAEEYILAHDWHGREKSLETAVKKAYILSEGEFLTLEDFDLNRRFLKSIGIGKFVEEKLKGFMKNIKNLESFNLYETVIPEVERALIVMVMNETRWNQTKAARLLGINRNTLRDKIKKLKIKK